MDSTPGLVVNKKRVEGVNSKADSLKELKKLKLHSGDAYCQPLGKQGAFSVGRFSPRKSPRQTVGQLSGWKNSNMNEVQQYLESGHYALNLRIVMFCLLHSVWLP